MAPGQRGSDVHQPEPGRRQPITDIADATPEDVDAAVKAAQEAFDYSGWVEMGGAERGRILYAAAEAIAADAENIAALETLEVGKLYRDGLMGDLPGDAGDLPLLRGRGRQAARQHRAAARLRRPAPAQLHAA